MTDTELPLADLLLRWATGATYAVDEVECIAASGKVCRFRISRQPA